MHQLRNMSTSKPQQTVYEHVRVDDPLTNTKVTSRTHRSACKEHGELAVTGVWEHVDGHGAD